jgi:hypothetical protein
MTLVSDLRDLRLAQRPSSAHSPRLPEVAAGRPAIEWVLAPLGESGATVTAYFCRWTVVRESVSLTVGLRRLVSGWGLRDGATGDKGGIRRGCFDSRGDGRT